MIDASHETFDKNVEITKRVVEAAHSKGLSVEAELGMLGGVEEDIKVEDGHATLTNPVGGQGFRQEDRLRLPRLRHRDEPRRLQVQGPPVAPLRRPEEDPDPPSRLPARHARLLLRPEGRGRPHQRRRRHRWATPWASTSNEYLPAAKLGVTKVNIDTDGRLVWTRVHREFFRDNPAEFDFRPPGKIFMDEYAKFIASRNDAPRLRRPAGGPARVAREIAQPPPPRAGSPRARRPFFCAMKLVFLFGKPAVGKLTVARELAARTGGRLFHNHLTVNLALSVYDFGSPGFVELREKIWMEVFRRAIADRLPLLIFTFNPENSVPQRFVDRLFAEYAAGGGEVIPVELVASETVIEERISSASRKADGKTMDLPTYRRLRAGGTFDSPVVAGARLVLDTANIDPAQTAERIAALL